MALFSFVLTVCFFTPCYQLFVLAVPLFKFLHRCCLVKQAQRYTTHQVFQVQYALERQDTTASVGRLCTFVKPMQRALAADTDACRHSQRIVSSQLFDEFTI